MKAEDLRKSILQMAIQGKLVPQNNLDEPASVLLQKIRVEKENLIKEGKIKRDKIDSAIFKGEDGKFYEKTGKEVKDITDQLPFEIPESWTWSRLGIIGVWGAGATPEKSNNAYYANATIPWLVTGDLNDGVIKDIPGRISELALKQTSVRLNPKDSVLIAMYGATIGKLGILSFPATTNQACCACQPFEGIDNWYLFYYLLAQRESFRKRGEGGAQPNISKEKIIATLVPIPPYEEQKRIVEAIEKFEPLIAEYDKLEQQANKLDSESFDKLKKAILQYAQLKQIPNVGMDDIYTGNGVSELINICMSALLDDGDEILIPSPDYPLWTACATLAGGTAVHYICDEQSDWYPDMADIRKKITDRTKAIVIINPNNPTGALYPKEVLQQIVDIAREYQLIIFSDEIYDRLVMDGEEHISIASMAPDLFCVTYSGLSKSHMIAGFRIGWMILSGNKDMAKDYVEGIKMLSNMRLCSNVPAQSIVQTALGGHQSVKSYVVPGGRIREQRDFIYKALTDIPGISAVKPKAAFYIFPKIDVKKFNIVDDEKFALDLLRDKKILLIHGGGFNWKQPDHFRVVFLPRIEVLKESVEKMADFFQYYHQ